MCVCWSGRTDEFELGLNGGKIPPDVDATQKEHDNRQSTSALRQQTLKQAVKPSKPRQTRLHAVAHGNVPTKAYY